MSNSTNATQIIDTLKTQANSVLSSAVGSSPLEAFNITSQGNFPYVWQNPSNLKFNAKTYNWIKGNLAAATSPYQFMAGSDFTNKYLQLASNIVWTLSKSDQAELNNAAAKATRQQAAVLNAWQSAFGSLPEGNAPINDIANTIATTWADPATTLQDIQSALNLGKLLNKVPAAGAPVLPVFVNWLNALGSSVPLQNQVTMNNAYLARAVSAIQDPSAKNGGLTLDDGSIQPGYAVANQVADIENALANAGSSVDLSMTVTRSTSSEYEVKMSGSTGFSIPIFDFISVGVGADANYFSSDIATTDNQTSVDMTFPGVNLVNFGPDSFTQAGNTENWFWMDPIREAIANGYQNGAPVKDVSGYKWASQPPITDFSDSGPFGYLGGAAISGYPTIKITVKSDSYQRIQKTFEQSVSSSVSFLGIKLASASESTYSNNVTVDTASSTVTITMTPPASLVAGKVADSVGWILGVQPVFPAA
tara:strand:+ start:13536 stop:14966 length:1431 start_codon:yes stop_codon:yes gene_type:complete